MFRQAGELIAAAAPDGDVKLQDPLLREYLQEIKTELVGLDGPSASIENSHDYLSQPRVVAFLEYFQGRGKSRLEVAHPEKSTRAAARYLRDLHALFGDWSLALAAYNWGEGRVARVTHRTGIRDFWVLANRGLMPQETINYVPSVIAASQLLMRNALP